MTKKLPHRLQLIMRDGEPWFVEERGLQRLELSLHELQPGQHLQQVRRLVSAARTMLFHAGMRTDEEVMIKLGLAAEDGTVSAEHPAEIERVLFENWVMPLVNDFGLLDPRSSAARFLWAYQAAAAWTAATAPTDPTEAEKFHAHLMECTWSLADAWYYWRVEAENTNAAAWQAEESRRNRVSGPEARKTEKVRRRAVVEKQVVRHIRDGMSPENIAESHFGSINAALAQDKLSEFSSRESLKRALGEWWPMKTRKP
jgi:hypothetical protein